MVTTDGIIGSRYCEAVMMRVVMKGARVIVKFW